MSLSHDGPWYNALDVECAHGITILLYGGLAATSESTRTVGRAMNSKRDTRSIPRIDVERSEVDAPIRDADPAILRSSAHRTASLPPPCPRRGFYAPSRT